jgi:uncharacterized protein (TIGR00251 family)
MGMVAKGRLKIEVRVTPRASRDQIVGWRQGALVVKVTAPPVDDAANKALIKLLAKRAGVPRSRVRIASGGRGRRKLVEIEGLGERDRGRLA